MKNYWKLAKRIIFLSYFSITSLFGTAQNVGIGIKKPTSKLHVNEDIKLAHANAILSVDTVPTVTPGAPLITRAGNANPNAGVAVKGGALILEAGNGNAANGPDGAGGNIFVCAVCAGGNLSDNLGGDN